MSLGVSKERKSERERGRGESDATLVKQGKIYISLWVSKKRQEIRCSG